MSRRRRKSRLRRIRSRRASRILLDHPKVIGVGVVGVGVAAIAGGLILHQTRKMRATPTKKRRRAAFDHASSLQTWTNVMFIAGAAVAAGGIALIGDPDRRRQQGLARAVIAPNGMSLPGTF